MSALSLPLLIDIVLACLLGVLIFYAMRLHKAFSALRQSKEEMETLFAEFSNSTEKAESAIARMKTATGDNGAHLAGLLGDAKTLRDDLTFLIERGEKVAGSLETGISAARGRSAPPPTAQRERAGSLGTNQAVGHPAPQHATSSVEDEIAAAVREARQLAGEERDPLLRRAEEPPRTGPQAGMVPSPGVGAEAGGEDALQAALERRLAAPQPAADRVQGQPEDNAGANSGSQTGDEPPKSRSALLRALQGMR